MLTLLVVETDESIRELLSEMLYYEGYRVLALDHKPSVDAICRARPDALILEIAPMAARPALQLIWQLRERAESCDLPILTTTTNNRMLDDLRPQLDRAGCTSLLKPFDLEVLISWAAALPQPRA